MAKMKNIVISNPTASASPKQTFAIFCLRKSLKIETGDVRKEGLTMEGASKEIGALVALKSLKASGVDIAPMIEARKPQKVA